MIHSEKRLLWTYFDSFQPIWEITEFQGHGKKGLYRIGPCFDSVCEKDTVSIQQYSGYDWKNDGDASWEFIQKVVDSHRAGKRGADLSKGLTREKSEVIWL